MKSTRQYSTLLWVGLYAIAMAYVESAVVVYLRRIYGILNFSSGGVAFEAQLGLIEVGREVATLVMLGTVGWIAGKKFQSRMGYAILAFGVWDIFYYIWLRVFIGWPQTLLDPDILFLIPLPWWGPVLAPVLVSLVLVAAGTTAVIREGQGRAVQVSLKDWAAIAAGVVIMLYAFTADALAALPASSVNLSVMGPGEFKWVIFLIGLVLAGAGVGRMGRPGKRE